MRKQQFQRYALILASLPVMFVAVLGWLHGATAAIISLTCYAALVFFWLADSVSRGSAANCAKALARLFRRIVPALKIGRKE
jgi:ABC-type transport system involved in cytochrome bd biosynthesis fused ATPase/permease subunit